MLWMKAWLETRWRLLYALVLPLTAVALPRMAGNGSAASEQGARTFIGVIAFFGIFNAAYLAGAGIKTQPPFAAMKGLEGSMYYTLSLPVSRLRLIVIRAGVGLLEFAGANAVAYSVYWLVFPLARGNSTVFDLLELIIAAVACTACFYFASVLLATFLDDPWQTFGGMFLAIVVWFAPHLFHSIISRISPPPQFNVFGFAGDASPLITHTFPWPAMAISMTASAVLFLAALKIADRREY
jgi:hypothetical protein